MAAAKPSPIRWAAWPVPKHRPEAARRLAEAVAVGFALPQSQVRPAYEDALGRLAAQVRLPEGDPVPYDLGADADTPDARAELVAKLDASVVEPTAYVLPLHRLSDGGGWASANWQLRRGRIVLTAGDSPAGLRLPLDAISWEPPEPILEPDPLAPAAELEYHAVANPGAAVVVEVADAPPTAVVVEQRGNFVYVFLPPLADLADFAELVGVLEQAAAVTDTKLVARGLRSAVRPARCRPSPSPRIPA